MQSFLREEFLRFLRTPQDHLTEETEERRCGLGSQRRLLGGTGGNCRRNCQCQQDSDSPLPLAVPASG